MDHIPLHEKTPGKLLILLLHAWVRVHVNLLPHYFIKKALNHHSNTAQVCKLHMFYGNQGNKLAWRG
jgi:hypothetical protein